MKHEETDLATLARSFGVPATKADVRTMLDLMWTDVAGATDIGDSHRRFYQHSSLLAFAADRWPDLDARINALGVMDFAEANATERAAIRRVVEQVLGQM